MSWEEVLKKFGEKQTPRKPYESKEEYRRRLENQPKPKKVDFKPDTSPTKDIPPLPTPSEQPQAKPENPQANKNRDELDRHINFTQAMQFASWLQKEVEKRFRPRDAGEAMIQRIMMNQAFKPMKKLADIYLEGTGGIKEWNKARREFANILLDGRVVGLLNNLRLAHDDESLERLLEQNGFGDGSD
tara:strand:+ start:2045 stop:2605 length:561 start_codon:yes stop_codon:yes gene_type:complete